MKYFIITYGCQMNKSDSERIAHTLESIGYQPASRENEADLILVNMCSVRQSAVDRVYGLLPKFKKLREKNLKLKTALTGCVLKKDKKNLEKSNGFDFILDIKNLPGLPEKLNTYEKYPVSQKHYLDIQPKYESLFSASVPIIIGCNNFCSFCVVPFSRGREISRPVKEILDEVKNLIKRNCKEIWLLGQNVNSYKSSIKIRGRKKIINFPKLLKSVNDIPGYFWIRFTSPHPKDFSDELITVMAKCKKVTPYLNLPVQSGDNEILRKMNRPYTVRHYKDLVKKLRKKIPEICLSTDVIVGFPGESKRQFQNTVQLFKEMKFDMAYIAQYSPRPGTAAFKLKDSVSRLEKQKRWEILNKALKENGLFQNKKYINKTVDVLAEDRKKGFLIGKSKSYKTVKFEGPKKFIGQFVKVRIVEALPWGLRGELTKA